MLRSIAGSPTGYKGDAALKIGKSAKLSSPTQSSTLSYLPL